MKTKLLIILVLSLTLMPLAGRSDPNDTVPANKVKSKFCELGMNIYSLDFAFTDYYYSYKPRAFNNYFCTGFYFKRFSGKSAFRASLNYLQRTSENKDSRYKAYGISGISSYKAGDLKLGYQRVFGSKRLSAYFFADLHYRYSQEEFSQPYLDPRLYNYIDTYLAYFPSRSFSTSRHQLGISKGLGLRWNVTNRLVLNLESSYEIYYYLQYETRSSRYNNRNAGFTFHPLELSVGFKF